MKRYAIILAAGKGRRMKSLIEDHSKVSFPILGKPMLEYVLDTVTSVGFDKIVVVSGIGHSEIENIVAGRATIVRQELQGDTAHAVYKAKDVLGNLEGETVILYGDEPLMTKETIEKVIKKYEKNNYQLTILTSVLANPNGFARVIRESKSNKLIAVKEEKECNEYEKYISEVSSGVCVFDNKLLFKHLDMLIRLKTDCYLFDLVNIFQEAGHKIDSFVLEDPEDLLQIGDRIDLAKASKVIRRRVNDKLMSQGVSIEDPDSTYISPDVIIEQDSVVLPNSHVMGNTIIGKTNTIGPNANINNTIIGDNNKIRESWISDSRIGNDNVIGPYARLRDDVIIKNHTLIGNFVELKNCVVEDNVCASHLSYLGDTNIGQNTNIGCMSVTANYDGYNKNHTEIGKNVFIGSGTILVAPVKVEDNGFTAAGSVITKDVKKDELAIERNKQVNIEHGSSKILNKAKERKS